MVLRASPYFRLNNGDPFIYAGYQIDFRGHIERLVTPITRPASVLIFPLRASVVFGQVWGYFILRYLLYLVATVPMCRAASARCGAALLGPTLFIANPVTTLAILTTHPDTIIVPLCCSRPVGRLGVSAAMADGSIDLGCGLAAGSRSTQTFSSSP